MNYAYTSARVRAMENSLLSRDTIQSLSESKDINECISVLNGARIDGSTVNELLKSMRAKKAAVISELVDDVGEIEVIFYPAAFHNLKAAIKKLYSGSESNMFYEDAPVSGDVILNALKNNDTASLPEYMSSAAQEAYREIMRTGDGRLSDMIVDKACLEAMIGFVRDTRFEILKIYVNETAAAADIRLAMRAKDNPELLDFAVSCSSFSKEALIRAVRDGKLDELIISAGYEITDISELDSYTEKRIADALSREKYNIFSPAPVINFILQYERIAAWVRYILVCKANGLKGGGKNV